MSQPKKTLVNVIPGMRYNDAPAAIEWLCRAFGFEKHLVVPGEKDGEIAHAQLRYGNGMIMLGSAGKHGGGFDELMLLSARNDSNAGLTSLLLDDLQEIFGLPAPRLSQKCTSPSSERLLALLETRDVGPFQAQLLRPALDSLGRVLASVNENYPELYRQLRTYGGLCARLVRCSDISVSRHSFGVAIDISIGGTLDAMGDGKTQFGLIILHELFYEEGWVWGAGFGREDSMHFEVSAELFQRWRDAGLL